MQWQGAQTYKHEMEGNLEMYDCEGNYRLMEATDKIHHKQGIVEKSSEEKLQ